MEQTQATNPVETEVKAKEDVKPTLEDIASQNKELNEKLEKVLKQNADKDSHISRIEGENASMRQSLEKVTASLEGKTETQKDTILAREKEKLVKKGYDAEAVDSLLESITSIAEQKAQSKVMPIIIDAAQDLVESDSEIDKEFLEKNQALVMDEYNTYKTELTPRKIKANLKKAYQIVKESLAKKAKLAALPEDERKRNEMLAGASPTPSGKKDVNPEEDFLDRIDRAGAKRGHFV